MKKWLANTGIPKWSIRLILLWLIIALFAPFLANDKAIVSKDNDGLHFPILTNYVNSAGSVTFSIKPPIPYNPNGIDYKNTGGISPFDKQLVTSTYYRHWLGTDHIGRDVLAGLIHGSRTALLIGFGAMFIAFLIGSLLGSIAAYSGDRSIRSNGLSIFFLLAFILLWLIISFILIPWEISSISLKTKLFNLIGISTILGVLAYVVISLSNKLSLKRYYIPLDLIIGRLIEIMESIPLLFLLVALSVVIKPSILSVVIIIGLVAWPSIAKFARAEVLKIKNTNFVENSRALGYSKIRLLIRHILPNALAPISISLTFGLAAAILLESTLSFMGLGVDAETASWGQILAAARLNYEAWWLALFPGSLIFLILLAINTIGEKLTQR